MEYSRRTIDTVEISLIGAIDLVASVAMTNIRNTGMPTGKMVIQKHLSWRSHGFPFLSNLAQEDLVAGP